MKKYKLTNNTKVVLGITLFQIQATISFSNIRVGDLGGYIEKESNLSHNGNAWVSGNAEVYGNAKVSGDAKVFGDAWVYGNASVHGNAEVYGDALVSGDALVYGNASVYGNAEVYGNAKVSGDAKVFGNSSVYGDAKVLKLTDIITFNFGEFKCTATKSDYSVVIGCQRKSIEEWLNCDYNTALDLGLDKDYDFELYRSFVQMCKIRFDKLNRGEK